MHERRAGARRSRAGRARARRSRLPAATRTSPVARRPRPAGRTCRPSGERLEAAARSRRRPRCSRSARSRRRPPGSARRSRSARPRRRPTVTSGRCPIIARPTIFSSAGRSRRGVRDVGRAHREPVHRRGRRTPAGRRRPRRPRASTQPYASVSGSCERRERLDLRRARARAPPRRGSSPSPRVVVVDARGRPWRQSTPAASTPAAGLRPASCAARARRGTRGSPGRRPRARSRARPSPSGSRACSPRRSARPRTRRRRPPAPARAG